MSHSPGEKSTLVRLCFRCGKWSKWRSNLPMSICTFVNVALWTHLSMRERVKREEISFFSSSLQPIELLMYQQITSTLAHWKGEMDEFHLITTFGQWLFLYVIWLPTSTIITVTCETLIILEVFFFTSGLTHSLDWYKRVQEAKSVSGKETEKGPSE